MVWSLKLRYRDKIKELRSSIYIWSIAFLVFENFSNKSSQIARMNRNICLYRQHRNDECLSLEMMMKMFIGNVLSWTNLSRSLNILYYLNFFHDPSIQMGNSWRVIWKKKKKKKKKKIKKNKHFLAHWTVVITIWRGTGFCLM